MDEAGPEEAFGPSALCETFLQQRRGGLNLFSRATKLLKSNAPPSLHVTSVGSGVFEDVVHEDACVLSGFRRL